MRPNLLFFQSPLQGKFDILVEQSLHDDCEVSVMYSLTAATPKYGMKALTVTNGLQTRSDVNTLPEFPELGWQAEYRISVDQDKITTHLEGTEIHTTNIGGGPSPWLMIQAKTPRKRSVVSNLRIVGEPTIPDELDLLTSANRLLWRADVYHGTLSTDGTDENAIWRSSGDEFVGSLIKDRTVENVENLLFYQRPMLEDGVITYEMYYDPDEFEANPALGGFAYLLHSDGVTRHQLTEGEYEQSGRAADNRSTIEGASTTVPLQHKEWNRIQLALKGDRLTINVNDEPVATDDVTAPPNERFFGVFRYSDQSKARIRNVVWRGEWPKTLPGLEDQQLAYPSRGALAMDDEHWSSIKQLDLTQSLDQIAANGVEVSNHDGLIATSSSGLQLKAIGNDASGESPSLSFNEVLTGDCELAVEFDKLVLEATKEKAGSGLSIRFDVDDESKGSVELQLALNDDGKPRTLFTHRHLRPNGDNHESQLMDHEMPTSGRLRLVRVDGVVYALFAAPGDDQFRFLGRQEIGASPIKRVQIAAVASVDSASVDVLLSNIALKTRSANQSVTQRGD